jgi:hypothetical protein
MISPAGIGRRGLLMSSKSQIVILAAAAVLCGCAAHPDPIIDMRGVNESAMQLDWDECEGYSEQVIIAKGTAKGAAGGAVAGAATGAISGHVGPGAGYGAVWGATRSTIRSDREKQMVFKRCLRGRGYQVLN